MTKEAIDEMLRKLEGLSGNLADKTMLTRISFVLWKLCIIEQADGGQDLEHLILSKTLDEALRGTIAEISMVADIDYFYQSKWKP